ncbi:hypothetical protein POM88_002329 [Heracleum sosnowskyi]|uniref:Uncharacterized protein n=1 Tax=Heracleum sosnowskyi TaxID=360622 RepID=A0AAD8NAF6_9APIA|nr:hypothetical protein POM88_002329 [Heracleum sosnowskyi]
MLQIAEAETLEEGTRHLAIEFVIILAEAREKAPGMMRKLPQFITRMLKGDDKKFGSSCYCGLKLLLRSRWTVVYRFGTGLAGSVPSKGAAIFSCNYGLFQNPRVQYTKDVWLSPIVFSTK